MRDLECLIETFARAKGFDDAMKLLIIEGVTFLEPVFENGGNADGRVAKWAYSGEEVFTVGNCGTVRFTEKKS